MDIVIFWLEKTNSRVGTLIKNSYQSLQNGCVSVSSYCVFNFYFFFQQYFEHYIWYHDRYIDRKCDDIFFYSDKRNIVRNHEWNWTQVEFTSPYANYWGLIPLWEWYKITLPNINLKEDTHKEYENKRHNNSI